MTTKEKAQDLFNKYENCYPKNYDKSGRNFFEDAIKKSALIAVDEILNHHFQEQSLYRIDTYYWREVKQEILKL